MSTLDVFTSANCAYSAKVLQQEICHRKGRRRKKEKEKGLDFLDEDSPHLLRLVLFSLDEKLIF